MTDTVRAVGKLAPDVREEAVRLALDLCASPPEGPGSIPDRSQLNTLLRAALGTPSTTEAVLFIRYQAARSNKSAFLAKIADEVERQRWAGDIDAVCFFLGSLVRAGHVARKAAEAEKRAGGNRGQSGRRG